MSVKDLLQVIASMCHLSSSGSIPGVDWPELVQAYQLSCQKYYINCISDKNVPGNDVDEKMMTCILKKGFKVEAYKPK